MASEQELTARAARLMSIYRTGKRDVPLTVDDLVEAGRWRLVVLCTDSSLSDEQAEEAMNMTRLN